MEIEAAEEAAAKLKGQMAGAGRQTDLEVAILKRQNDELRNQNARAGELIDKATGILEKLAISSEQ